jgi:hypothetical protein
MALYSPVTLAEIRAHTRHGAPGAPAGAPVLELYLPPGKEEEFAAYRKMLVDHLQPESAHELRLLEPLIIHSWNALLYVRLFALWPTRPYFTELLKAAENRAATARHEIALFRSKRAAPATSAGDALPPLPDLPVRTSQRRPAKGRRMRVGKTIS